MGMRTEEGEYVIVASNVESQQILSDYAKRWQIETLFGRLKSRGFCLEENISPSARDLRDFLL